MTFTERAFRDALGRFATGVTVVTAVADGRPIGMTVNSFSSVSLDPPLILFALGLQTHVYDDLAKADHFAVNMLAAGQEDLSVMFAGPVDARFEGVSWREGPASGAPLLAGCMAHLECATEHRYPGGDHLILVGRVLALGVDEAGVNPLIYFHSGYRSFDAEEAPPSRRSASVG